MSLFYIWFQIVLLLFIIYLFIVYSWVSFFSLVAYVKNYNLPKPKPNECSFETCGYFKHHETDENIQYCLHPRVSRSLFSRLRPEGKKACRHAVALFEPPEKRNPAENYLDLYLKLSSNTNILEVSLRLGIALFTLYLATIHGLPKTIELIQQLFPIS